MSGLRSALLRARGTPQWDVVLRGSLVVALVALYPTWRWPEVAGLVAFLGITIFVNGPLAPLLPATYEPILMVTGRAYSPLLVAAVGVVGTLYVEFLNYHLYRAAILRPEAAVLRDSRVLRFIVAVFKKSPFFSVWLCAWSPLPYWAVRILAPLARYPVRPYLVATLLGRAPRLWFFAALGLFVRIPTSLLVAVTALMIGLAVAIAAVQQKRARSLSAERRGRPLVIVSAR
jgi:uncharacterized membrane protein YdjX (TVP38/TMEM64 family)